MANYSEGEYACRPASGIQDGYRDKLIQTCIKLFVDNPDSFCDAAAGRDFS